jgi:hypothetical protein
VVRQLATWNLITELDQTTLSKFSAIHFMSKKPDFACRLGLVRIASSPTDIRNVSTFAADMDLEKYAPSQLNGDTLTQKKHGQASLRQ